MTTNALMKLALQYGDGFGAFRENEWNLPWQSLVLGWIATESDWNPFAIRYEPGFYTRWVPASIKQRSPTEARARAFSWGLGQMMGQVAREQGLNSRFISELLDPALNLVYCVRYLVQDRKPKSDGTWNGALASYNGGLGGNRSAPFRNQFYTDKVVARSQNFARSNDPAIRRLLS